MDVQTVTLTTLANKRGMVAYLCDPSRDGRIPDYTTRRKIDMQVAKSVHEHLIIYIDADKTTQVWQWVKRETGKPLASREHTFHSSQSGDSLIQKLEAIAFSIAEEEKWFDDFASRHGDIILAVETPEGRYIGNVSVFGINWKNRTATFGVVIFVKDCWGRGYGTDAAMALLDYAFHRLNLRKITSSVMAYNERSKRLHAALGMVQEGVRRKETYHNGEYHDELIFGVFREEWESRWRAYQKRYAAGAKGRRRRAS